MAVFELARYRADPSKDDELQTRWRAAVEAIRAAFPELREASLARLADGTWIDVWRWDTNDAAQRAAAEAPAIPEAAALFGLIDEVVAMEHAEIASEG